MTKNTSTRLRRALAGLLAVTLAAGPGIEAAYGALTSLSDLPIASKVTAKPNILYTLDDSGSMTLNYLPVFVINSYYRSGIGNTTCAGVPGNCSTNFSGPPFLAADFNHLTYNPNVTYTAPIKADGTSYPDQNAATTTNWTKVQSDPYLTPLVTVSLTPQVAVPVFCNSDWPLTTTVGDVNSEYKAGTGADCRINGTKYDAAANGAPAATDDYNYPWQLTVAPAGAQYFYAATAVGGVPHHGAGGAMTLWCNTASPGWPHSATINSCTCPGGGNGCVVNPAPTVQTCNAPVAQCNPTPALRNYNQGAGCRDTVATADLYCAAGTGGSDGNPPPVAWTGTVPECSACTCKADFTPATGKCSSTGVVCTGPYGVAGGDLAQCPNVPNPTITSCGPGTPNFLACAANTANCTCTSLLNGSATTKLIDDANLVNGGTGATCRHNNQNYTAVGGPAASPFNYTNYPLTAPFTTQVNSGCPALPNTVNIPRHYYTVASVQFCNAANAVNNAQWKGFGTGVCQGKNDFTTFLNIAYGKFTRVDLVNDGRTFAFIDPINGPSTRTYAQEMTNYSNWYAYYRTRVLAAKTTTAIAFSFLDATNRVGFHTLNTPATNWVDVQDWTLAQRNVWYPKLFAVTIPPAQTPSLDVLLRVGELFRTGAGGQGILPAMPEGFIPNTALDPVTVSCQKNYHIYFTDGFTNQPTEPASFPFVAPYGATGEVDGVNAPAAAYYPPDPDTLNHPEVTVQGLRNLAGKWPNPILDPTPTAGTLADIALYYWMTDLRPAGLWPANISKTNVPSNDGRVGRTGFCAPISPPSVSPTACAALDWSTDPAFWQHVNFSAISFGSEGILDASNAVTVTNNIASGANKWFTGVNVPSPPNNPNFPAGNKGATAVDDLWHATVNARGTFVYAKDPQTVSNGLGTILAGIQNQEKSRAGTTFSTNVLTALNHAIYDPTIEPGWAGDLKKIEVDPTTLAQTSVDWDALSLLNTLLATPIPPANDSLYPWFANRRIVAWNPASGTAVPFLFANLTAAQLTTLAPTVAQQKKMIAYLRGGSVAGAPAPVSIEGTAIGQFRQRFGKLGDISDSRPLVINPPNSPWSDSTDPGYSAFVALRANRAVSIYVGANDGMLHVFDGNTGAEDFAYIPGAVFTSAVDQDGAAKGIQALTFQDGGAPRFKHHFYVDGSPRVSDVDFGNTGGSVSGVDWHTIVVGGLGKGGGSIYAIDATIPVATTDSEATAAGKVLWEFTAPDMQFSHSAPIVGKTRADGWVVVVANGYDAPSGKGKVYMINAKTGALIRTLATTAADTGTPAAPSGLGQINGFTQDFHNQIIEQIYAGDLNGNFWRWDVSDPNPGNWKTVLFAQLTDPSGVAQPVTTAPQIEIDILNATDRWVFVGTGRLLHSDDLTIPTPEQIETMYAMRDGSLTLPSTAGLPIVPRATLAAANALGTAAIVGAVPNGWYMDLPLGQRIVTNLEADLNVVTFIGTEVPNDPCLTALPAFIYAREFTTAESDVIDSGTGATLSSFFSAQGAVSNDLIATVNPLSPNFPTLMIGFSRETNGGIGAVKVQPKSFGSGVRMSWRLLGD
jgi:type IV pilus assembly protein PilY1